MVVAENHTCCNQTEEQIHALTLKDMATTKKTTSPKTAEKKAPAKKATAKKETAAPAAKAPVREALTAEEKARVKKLKETVKGSDTEAIKADTEALEKSFYPLAEKLYQAAQAAQGDAGANPGAGAQGGDGTFYNADFEDKSDK